MSNTASQLTYYDVDNSIKPLVNRLAVGNSELLRDQLIAKSRQPNILKFTPNDAAKRFGSIDMFDKWLSKGRELHWLLGPDDDLAGIIWYGKSPFTLDLDLAEIPQETFAIRIYEGYSGHGLARPFMKLSLKAHVKLYEKNMNKASGIWLTTDTDNAAALSVYHKFGFEDVFATEKRATLVLTSNKIAEIINLTDEGE